MIVSYLSHIHYDDCPFNAHKPVSSMLYISKQSGPKAQAVSHLGLFCLLGCFSWENEINVITCIKNTPNSPKIKMDSPKDNDGQVCLSQKY